MTSKRKTKELMETLEKRQLKEKMKKQKLKRARGKKGRYVADDPSTPENEAFLKTGVPINHIKEATEKARKSNGFFLFNWIKRLFGVLR